MITIITVNWNSYDFLNILIESLQRFSSLKNDLIVIDNSEIKQIVKAPNTHQYFMPINIGHGQGLNHGIVKDKELFPNNKYVMFLDVDTHFISRNWEKYFIEQMNSYEVIGGKGVPAKPIRPACMFMKKHIAQKYDWSDTQGYKGHRVTPEGYDVAIKAYHQMISDQVKIGFLGSMANYYGTLNGEIWSIDQVPLVYHHWHGSHLKIRQTDFKDDLLDDKELLFTKIPWRIL